MVLFPSETEDFSLQNIWIEYGAYPSIQWVLGVKRPEHEAEYNPLLTLMECTGRTIFTFISVYGMKFVKIIQISIYRKMLLRKCRKHFPSTAKELVVKRLCSFWCIFLISLVTAKRVYILFSQHNCSKMCC